MPCHETFISRWKGTSNMFAARSKMWVAALLLLNMATAARANDIEDFFKTLRGGANRRPPQSTAVPVGHERGPGYAGRHAAGTPRYGSEYPSHLSSRDWNQQYQLSEQQYTRSGRGNHSSHQSHHYRHDGRDRYDHQRSRADWRTPVATRSGTHLSFRISSGAPSGYGETLDHPAAPTYWPETSPHMMPIRPNPGQMHGVPTRQGFPISHQLVSHQLGDIITCPVPLATCVRVEDAHRIAPNAVPVIVAVRDPHLPPHHTGCQEQLVYVEVFVPPCPLRRLTVSPCRTRIKMDFGHHEVDLCSRNGLIVVDYD